MKLVFDADLRPHNSFGVAARAACLAEIGHSSDLPQAVETADARGLPLLLLGGGTNVLFVGDFPGMVLLMRSRGVEIDRASGQLVVAAGENWHELVRSCLCNRLYGLENLAMIPGSVGAAPVQNIGAYGVEFESFFIELAAYDCADGRERIFTREACGFSYRDSLLKKPRPRPLVVSSVTLRLHRKPAPRPEYPALAEELKSIAEPAPRDIYQAVCRIRRRKLPDPAVLGNAGSFFKNPVLTGGEFDQLRQHPLYRKHPSPPVFATAAGMKVSAGWLLEQCGFKGHRRGDAGVFERHALILVNHGGAGGAEIHRLAMSMCRRVLEEFGIELEPEVRIVGVDNSP